MIINQVTTYTMELNYSEFEVFHRICESIGYKYEYIGNHRDCDGYWIVTLNEDMMYDAKKLLQEERDYQYYEECNRLYSEEIGVLVNEIYYEVNCGY